MRRHIHHRRFSQAAYLKTCFGEYDPESFLLCGMDEVGRGAFAGPLVAAAVVLPLGYKHKLLKDSKLLTPTEREKMDVLIRKKAIGLAIAEISAAEINRYGLGWANKEIFRRLVLLVEADGYCCDGRLNIDADRPIHSLVKGDQLIPAISAASIIAKVYRDSLMRDLHETAPVYNWASNKGYGAKVHRDAVKTHGPHAEHRTLFIAPLMQLDLYEDPGVELVAAAAASAAAPAHVG